MRVRISDTAVAIFLAGLMVLVGSCTHSRGSRYDMMPSTGGCGYRLNRATGELIRFGTAGQYLEVAKTRIDTQDGN